MNYESAMAAETTPFPKTDDIPYEMQFTRDPQLIAGYKKLRQQLYGIDPRFVGFRIFNDTAAEDYEDEDDQMLILHYQGIVYGGACLRVSTPKHPIILDSEQDILPAPGEFYFSLKDRLPQFELDKYAYCEFVRIVVHPSLRKGVAIKRLYQAALERCLEHRVRYMIGIADRVRMRLYRQIYGSFGLHDEVLNIDIPMRQEYEDLKMHLILIDMKKMFVTPQDANATCLLEPLENFEFY